MEEQAVVNNPIQQSPAKPVPVDKKQNHWIIALIVFVAFIVVSIMYMNNLKLQKQMVPPPPEPPLPPKVTLQPSPSDQTANWKTYTNTKYGFSLEYPSDLVVTEQILPSQIYEGVQAPYIDMSGKTFDFTIIVESNPKMLTIDKWILEQRRIEKEQCEIDCLGFSNPTENIMVADKNAILQYLSSVIGSVNVFFPLGKENIIWAFSSYKANPQVPLETRTMLLKILSTFKFTDQENQVVCTQDVKQCPNGSYVSRQPPTCEFAICP